jgi:hypothetical protein
MSGRACTKDQTEAAVGTLSEVELETALFSVYSQPDLLTPSLGAFIQQSLQERKVLTFWRFLTSLIRR